ncbi:protein EMBRYO DEFECTIVE 514 [Heracleum sosnowskyi]|uniref:Protein EMBRYO DEFECTIVE 514 n=1 Tax=Heracleum sosnowskyi TaxID=360622 RepID=A0AAD8M2R4_9APIA|nr:protein EMBRYO DEFECTIVE 514 [Heracleum sosnowskyi]
MAEELKTESSALDMELSPVVPVSDQADGDAAANGVKRKRDDGDELEGEKETSVEEERLEMGSGPKGPVSLGFKSFATSVEIFDYFFALLHRWSPNVDVNKYEHMMLLDLLKKGHQEPEKKIGDGVNAFQVRYHPEFKSRCFFIIRNDDSVDDFSFRKCVDHILPLPENMQKKPSVNKALGGQHGGGGRGGGGWRGRGRGRGGKPRN